MVGITFNVVITGDTNFTLIGINGFHIALVDGGFVGARCLTDAGGDEWDEGSENHPSEIVALRSLYGGVRDVVIDRNEMM